MVSITEQKSELTEISASLKSIAETIRITREESQARDKTLASLSNIVLSQNIASRHQNEKIDKLAILFTGGMKDMGLRMFGEVFFSSKEDVDNSISMSERIENVEKSLKKIESDAASRKYYNAVLDRAPYQGFSTVEETAGLNLNLASTRDIVGAMNKNPVLQDSWEQWKEDVRRDLSSKRISSYPQNRKEHTDGGILLADPDALQYSTCGLYSALSAIAANGVQSHTLRPVGSSFDGDHSTSSRQPTLEPLNTGSSMGNASQLIQPSPLITSTVIPETPFTSRSHTPDQNVDTDNGILQESVRRSSSPLSNISSGSHRADFGDIPTPTPTLSRDIVHSPATPIVAVVDTAVTVVSTTPLVQALEIEQRTEATAAGLTADVAGREGSVSSLSDLTSLSSLSYSGEDGIETPASSFATNDSQGKGSESLIAPHSVSPRESSRSNAFSEITLSSLIKSTPLVHRMKKTTEDYSTDTPEPQVIPQVKFFRCTRGCNRHFKSHESLQSHQCTSEEQRTSSGLNRTLRSAAKDNAAKDNGPSTASTSKRQSNVSDYRPRKKRRMDRYAPWLSRNVTAKPPRPVAKTEATVEEAIVKLKKLGAEPVWPTKARVNMDFESKSIRCDICERYYHYRCSGIVANDQRIQANVDFICALCECSPADDCTKASADERKRYCCRPDCDLDINVDDDEERYDMERIIGHVRTEVDNENYWLVKWEGFGLKDCKWIPTRNMSHGGDEMRREFVKAAVKEGKKKQLAQNNVPVLLKEAIRFGFSGLFL